MKKIPSWFMLMMVLAIVPLALYGFFKAVDMTKTAANPNLYWLAAYSFLVPVFIAIVYLITTQIEDEWDIKYNKSSAYRRDMYRQQLRGRLNKRGGKGG